MKKKKKKISKLSQYRRNSRAIIKRGINDGYENELLRMLGTLDINELVKSRKGHEKIKHTMKVIRERHGILIKEAEKLSDKQLGEIKDMYGQRAVNSLRRDRTYKKLSLFADYRDKKKHDIDELRGMINEMKSVNGVTHYKNMMRVEIDDFFDDYFKEVRLNNKYQVMIKDMKDYFAESDALSNFYDFCNFISSDKFKGNYYPDKSDVDEYESMMIDRLHRAMDVMINNTYL